MAELSANRLRRANYRCTSSSTFTTCPTPPAISHIRSIPRPPPPSTPHSRNQVQSWASLGDPSTIVDWPYEVNQPDKVGDEDFDESRARASRKVERALRRLVPVQTTSPQENSSLFHAARFRSSAQRATHRRPLGRHRRPRTGRARRHPPRPRLDSAGIGRLSPTRVRSSSEPTPRGNSRRSTTLPGMMPATPQPTASAPIAADAAPSKVGIMSSSRPTRSGGAHASSALASTPRPRAVSSFPPGTTG